MVAVTNSRELNLAEPCLQSKPGSIKVFDAIIATAASETEVPCSMNEVEECDCSRWRSGMKMRQRSGTPGDNERRDGYSIKHGYHIL